MRVKMNTASAFAAGPFLLGAGAVCAGEEGFKPIVNGKDLAGWDGAPKFWSVQDGAITGQTTTNNPTRGNTFLVWRDGEVGDFELRLSYRLIGGNSGVQSRSEDFSNWVIGGYQADMEAGDSDSGILYEERMTRGIMAEGVPSVVSPEDLKKNLDPKGR